jgi:hypothetical protein
MAFGAGPYLAPASATHTLDGGTIDAHRLIIGRHGVGLLTQNDGAVRVTDTLTLGQNVHVIAHDGLDLGTYDLNGGTLEAAMAIVGDRDHAVIDQAGGTATLGERYVGYRTTNAHPGRYELADGDLVGQFESIGRDYDADQHAHGLFDQSGGVHHAHRLLIASQGKYIYRGGELHIGKSFHATGPFDFADAATSLYIDDQAVAAFEAGSLLRGTSATINVGLDAVLLLPEGFEPGSELAAINSQGIVHVGGEPLIVGSDQLLHGDLDISGDVTNGGDMAPGFSPGQIAIDGQFHQIQTGTLHIEVAGTDHLALGYDLPCDLVTATGEAQLDGTLSLSLLEGFVAQPGESYTIITAASIDGRFDKILGTSVSGLMRLSVAYGDEQVRIVAVEVPEPASLGLLAIGAIAMACRRR